MKIICKNVKIFLDRVFHLWYKYIRGENKIDKSTLKVSEGKTFQRSCFLHRKPPSDFIFQGNSVYKFSGSSSLPTGFLRSFPKELPEFISSKVPSLNRFHLGRPASFQRENEKRLSKPREGPGVSNPQGYAFRRLDCYVKTFLVPLNPLKLFFYLKDITGKRKIVAFKD